MSNFTRLASAWHMLAPNTCTQFYWVANHVGVFLNVLHQEVFQIQHTCQKKRWLLDACMTRVAWEPWDLWVLIVTPTRLTRFRPEISYFANPLDSCMPSPDINLQRCRYLLKMHGKKSPCVCVGKYISPQSPLDIACFRSIADGAT